MIDVDERQRVLIVNRNPDFLRALPRQLSADRPHVVADTVRELEEAIERLRGAGYDAVLLAVEGPDGHSLVIRIRDAAKAIPVLALVPRPNPALDFLAREGLADEVIHTGSDSRVAARTVGRVLETWRLLERSRAAIRGAEEQVAALDGTRRQWENLHETSFALHRVPVTEFRPLLVEPDPADAAALRGAFDVVRLPFPLPALRSAEDALRHLESALFPRPTLLLLADRRAAAQLPALRAKSGPLPVLSLGEPIEGCDVALAKPATIAGWIQTARRIAIRWARLRRS